MKYSGTRKRTDILILVDLKCTKCGKDFQRNVPSKEVYRYKLKAKCNNCLSEINKLSKLKLQEGKSWNECSLGEKQRRVLREQNNQCMICGNPPLWMNKPIKFHFDHINGNHLDNSRENVRFICPNCHSQTETYCRYRVENRVSDEIFVKTLQENNWKIDPSLKQLNLVRGGDNWKRAKRLMKQYGGMA
jgi:hypothetical protein